MNQLGTKLGNWQLPVPTKFYIEVKYKFFISNLIAMAWFMLSCYISYPWIVGLSMVIGVYPAWFIVIFIALIPGYLNTFLIASLLFDKPPKLKKLKICPSITILIAAYNEEKCISNTLESIKNQDYCGEIEVIIIDDGSTDKTREAILNTKCQNLNLINADHEGKASALNMGLLQARYEYIITIDADTFLHPQAVRRIVSRFLGDPESTAAVAGCVLAKNSRETFMTKLQEWDYFLAIASVKRQQALYQGTLVAQGAFSIYKTKILKQLGGWPDCIGEDIVLTWGMLKEGYRIGFESSAIAFTDVPTDYKSFAKQRKRWARGMIEGFKKHIDLLIKNFSMAGFLVMVDLLFPILDLTYTFIYIPGIVLGLMGHFWIFGPMAITVLPLTFLINYIMYKLQLETFNELSLKVRNNKTGFIMYVLIYQIIMSPLCVLGYFEEFLCLTKKW